LYGHEEPGLGGNIEIISFADGRVWVGERIWSGLEGGLCVDTGGRCLPVAALDAVSLEEDFLGLLPPADRCQLQHPAWMTQRQRRFSSQQLAPSSGVAMARRLWTSVALHTIVVAPPRPASGPC